MAIAWRMPAHRVIPLNSSRRAGARSARSKVRAGMVASVTSSPRHTGYALALMQTHNISASVGGGCGNGLAGRCRISQPRRRLKPIRAEVCRLMQVALVTVRGARPGRCQAPAPHVSSRSSGVSRAVPLLGLINAKTSKGVSPSERLQGQHCRCGSPPPHRRRQGLTRPAAIEAGVDLLGVDTSHVHSRLVLAGDAHQALSNAVQVLAGTVATVGAKALIDAGRIPIRSASGPARSAPRAWSRASACRSSPPSWMRSMPPGSTTPR